MILTCPLNLTDYGTDIFLTELQKLASPSSGRGGWSEFDRYLVGARPEYRAFLEGLGFRHFLSIQYAPKSPHYERLE